MTEHRRTAAALLILLFLTLGFYRDMIFSSGYTWLDNPDQALQVRPWLDYEAREIHAGRLPLWEPYQIGGSSLIGQVQPGLVNPLNWILFAMPLRDGHIPLTTLHWYWVLIHWVAAVLCFLLCRDLGARWGASLLGASIFAFAGFIGHSATPQFLMSAVWFPLVLMFFARVFRGERPLANAARGGAALGLAFLGGHHNVPIYGAVLLAALWLWYVGRQWRRLRYAAVFFVTCGLIAAVQVLPAVEYGRAALRWSGAPEAQKWNDPVPYSVHAEYSLHARSIPGMLVPGLSVHANPFVGIVALTLVYAAIRRQWGSRQVRLAAAFALGSLLLALGADSPVHWLAYHVVPLVEKARYPAMAIVLTQIGIAALAAMGASKLTGSDSHAAALPAALAGIGIAGTWLVLTMLHRAPADHPVWRVGAVAVLLAALLAFRRPYAPALLLLFFVEATAVPLPFERLDQPDSLLKKVKDQADIAQFLRQQPGWFRFTVDVDAVPYNFGDLYGLEQFDGYLASMPLRINRILGDQRTPAWFGIEYYIGRKPARTDQVQVYESPSGVKVYRNPGIGQPLWVARQDACGTPDVLKVARRVPEEMIVDADLGCAGVVVAGDPWFQGWRAWVDGKRVSIGKFEDTLRAVPVGAGRHRIEFRYRPGSVYWGAALSGFGIVLTAMICALDRGKLGAAAQIR